MFISDALTDACDAECEALEAKYRDRQTVSLAEREELRAARTRCYRAMKALAERQESLALKQQYESEMAALGLRAYAEPAEVQ